MKKMIGLVLAAALLISLSACAGNETETGTDPVASDSRTEEATDAKTETEEAVTTEEVTEEDVTTSTETEPDEATTEAETKTSTEFTDEKYEFDKIYVMKPVNYTFKDFSGVPSGLRNGEAEGTCFFNFMTRPHADVMTEDAAKAFLDTLVGAGTYEFINFSSYETDGAPVTKLDYSWGEGGAIIQSIVTVYFDTGDDVITFGVLNTIPEGVTEFDDMIKTLGVIK